MKNSVKSIMGMKRCGYTYVSAQVIGSNEFGYREGENVTVKLGVDCTECTKGAKKIILKLRRVVCCDKGVYRESEVVCKEVYKVTVKAGEKMEKNVEFKI